MTPLLRKGINTTYLLPLVVCYAGLSGLAGLRETALIQSVIANGGAACLTGIALLVLQEILPRSAKEALIYWRLKDRLPGCRAFTVHAPRDQRIDPTDLAVLLPSGPMNPGEQNALWYRWLRSLDEDPAVFEAHRRSLILREVAVLLALMALATPLRGWALPYASAIGTWRLTATLLLGYFVVATAARNAGVRLVGTVMARKLAKS